MLRKFPTVSLATLVALASCCLVQPAGAQGIMEAGSVWGSALKGGGNAPNAGAGAQNAGRNLNSILGGGRGGRSSPANSPGVQSSFTTQRYVDPEVVSAAGVEATKLYLQARKSEQAGKTAEAQKLYSQSLRLREEYWADRDPAIFEILNIQAKLYKKNGQTAELEDCYRHILKSGARKYGPGAFEMCPTMVAVADLCFEQRKYADAAGFYKQAVALKERMKASDEEMTKLKLPMADSLAQSGKSAEAESLYKALLESKDRSANPDKGQLLRILLGYSGLLREADRTDEAERLEARAKTLKGDNGGDVTAAPPATPSATPVK
jgi:tetratricopeptide (TPR) repeat protein